MLQSNIFEFVKYEIGVMLRDVTVVYTYVFLFVFLNDGKKKLCTFLAATLTGGRQYAVQYLYRYVLLETILAVRFYAVANLFLLPIQSPNPLPTARPRPPPNPYTTLHLYRETPDKTVLKI